MAIPSVVDRDFGKLVLDADEPVLVAFRASWCLPSQQLVPIIDALAERFGKQVRFVAIDSASQSASIRRRHRVDRLPVTMLFDQGRCVDFIGGLASKESLEEMLERRLKPVLQVDEYTFDSEVMTSRIPVLAHFDATWCQESRALAPVINQVADKFRGGAKVVRIEFGPDTARLCARFGVTRVPTVALFVDGGIRDQIFGLTSFENTAKMLEPFIL